MHASDPKQWTALLNLFLAFLSRIDCMRCGVIDVPSICQSVSLSVTQLRCAKTIERIEVLLGVETTSGPRNFVLDEGRHLDLDVDFAKLLFRLRMYISG